MQPQSCACQQISADRSASSCAGHPLDRGIMASISKYYNLLCVSLCRAPDDGVQLDPLPATLDRSTSETQTLAGGKLHLDTLDRSAHAANLWPDGYWSGDGGGRVRAQGRQTFQGELSERAGQRTGSVPAPWHTGGSRCVGRLGLSRGPQCATGFHRHPTVAARGGGGAAVSLVCALPYR